MMQVPPETSVSVAPETLQTVGVSEAKLTASPEFAVAVNANGVEPKGRFGSAPKLIVCGATLSVALALSAAGCTALAAVVIGRLIESVPCPTMFPVSELNTAPVPATAATRPNP